VVLGQLKSTMNLVMQFGIVGTNNLIVRLFTKKHFKSNVFQTIISLSVGINILLVSLGLIYIDNITVFLTGSLQLHDSVQYLIFAIPAITLIALNMAIINGKQKQILFGVLILSHPVIFFWILTMTTNMTLSSMVNAFVLSILISSASVTFYNSRYFIVSLKKTMKLKMFKKVMNYGFTLLFSFLVNTLVLIYLRTLLMEKDAIGAGLWQAVWQVSDNIAGVIYLYIISVLLPKALKVQKPLETIIFLIKHYQLPLLLFILGGSIFIIFSEQILLLLYDQSFLPAQELIIYQLIGDFFKVIGWIFLLTISSYGLLKLSVLVEIINLLSSLLLIHYFITTYSFIGASYAYMLKYIVYVLTLSIVFYLYTKPKIKVIKNG